MVADSKDLFEMSHKAFRLAQRDKLEANYNL
ncbi:hypothetical protein BCL90_0661 [Pedobacter alluvionis]|uniref:Uncharacterized protein n=1 Tax=Pedobacter alluvionis TaxID=475253 RepID=A0A497YBT5_9SPHI|nr:hypothetical protein BCL90_0661 [Pedobacter alluvionis]